MRSRTAKLVLVLAALCALLAAVGCTQYEPESTEQQAQAYYQDKYHVPAQVTDSHGLGNYALFGYEYHGMEYVMSDGASVVYFDDEGVFRDNRQATEIHEAAVAFASQKLNAMPGALTPIDVAEVGDIPYEQTYVGETVCWHARYDDDIAAFLEQERPRIVFKTTHHGGTTHEEGRFSYDIAYDASKASGLEDAYLQLNPYFDLQGITLAVVDADGFTPEGISLFDDRLHYTIQFRDSDGTTIAERFKPAFITVMDGISLSSATPGVTLKDGDIRFEPTSKRGYFRCAITGDAAARRDTMHYYLRNETDQGITQLRGIDSFSTVCEAHEHRAYCSFEDGGIYYFGNSTDIRPWVEIEQITANQVTIRYHTHFKPSIKNVQFQVIGRAYRDDAGGSETVAFDSRIVDETEDGWRCEIDIPDNAVPQNELALQFTYNNDSNVSVQIIEEITLPR